MNYGYGSASAGPYFNPYASSAGWGGYPGYGGYAGFGYPSFGYGTAVAPPVFVGATWQAPDDQIKYFVENAIDNDPEVPAHADITVDVHNGDVTLSGTVSNKRIKHAAGDDAWWVPAVMDVHNEITVSPRRERSGGGSESGTSGGRRSRSSGR